jgi:pimeloyl-ACP methyl ester carboxylesterase
MFASADKEKWKTEGRIFVHNSRTNQEMPVNYSYWQDLESHREELDVLRCAGLLEMPMILMHGDADESVPMTHSEKIYEQCLHSVLIPIPGASHTFNAGHPMDPKAKFPAQLQELLINTVEFILD